MIPSPPFLISIFFEIVWYICWLFAEIKNNIVQNVLVADFEFAKLHAEQNDFDVIEFKGNLQDDDTLVARIGEGHIQGKFVNGNQAVELGLLTVEEAKTFGFHSGQEYKEYIE